MARSSIPTRYRGIRFRSKLEADWARVFDRLGLRWEYEKEGHYFGDTFYLPDFWLPASRQFVEVKGVWDEAATLKASALVTHNPKRPHLDQCPDVPLVVCEPYGNFWGWGRNEYRRFDRIDLELAQCGSCRGWWFFDADHGWHCQCCGAHRGRKFANLYRSPLLAVA